MRAFENECVHWFSRQPTSDADDWPSLDEIPEKGSPYWAFVEHPFVARANERFWVVACPPTSHWNGWAEAPNELAESGIVQAELLQVEDELPERGPNHPRRLLVRLLAVHVVRFDSLARRLDAEPAPPDPSFFLPGDVDLTCYRDFALVEANAQSDLGAWMLVQAGRILAFAEWGGAHGPTCLVGHTHLTQSLRDEIESRTGKRFPFPRSG